jgi:diguanylate cyclase (GGDEF)-like protein
MYAHTPTMYLMAVTVSLALAVSVATLVPMGERRREGMLLWAMGLSLYALTYLLFGLRGRISDFLSIVLGNTALSGALAMLTHALLVFQDRQWTPSRIWAPVTAVFAMLVAVDSATVQLLAMAVVLGAQSLTLVVIVVQRLPGTVGRGKYLVIGGLLIAIGIFVSRVVGVAVGTVQSTSITESSPLQTVTHLLGLVVMIFLTVGFVIMTKERSDALNVVLAMRDELTQLHNRRATLDSLARQLAAARRNQTPLSVLMLDVDNFKALNDGFGHTGGDRVLREIAATIQQGLRAQDVAGRMGGEEFLVLLPHSTAEGAAQIAERLRRSIREIDCLERCRLATTISVSIGAAQFDPLRHKDTDGLIHEADQALYRAKARGRNRVEMAAHSASVDSVAVA